MGFRKHHSTVKSAFSLVSYICNAKNNREYTVALFLDLSKAFDSINHKLLLDKLENIGIVGHVLSWITNNLSNQKQFVHLDNINSDQEDVVRGVPQGSVIGPNLFLIYVNDIVDTVIYRSGNDLEHVTVSAGIS